MLKFNNEVAEWAEIFFRKLIDILPYFISNEKVTHDKISNLQSYYSKFLSLIINSSPRLVDKYTNLLLSHLLDNPQKMPTNRV